MHLRINCSFCVAIFFARTTGSKPALEWREHWFHYAALVVRIFKLFRILFLPPEHLCPWTESLYHMVLAGADHRSFASITDHSVVRVCIISCIKHHTSCAIRNLFDHIPERRRMLLFLALDILAFVMFIALAVFRIFITFFTHQANARSMISKLFTDFELKI